VLDGWVWHADLGSGRTCMSCVAMHGTQHGVGEVLNDHYTGRCAAVPVVRGFENPVEQTGEEWFAAQDEATQRSLLGVKYTAWSEGKFGLADIPGITVDEVYGPMRVEKSLRELVR